MKSWIVIKTSWMVKKWLEIIFFKHLEVAWNKKANSRRFDDNSRSGWKILKNDDILNLSKLQQDKNKKRKRSICHEYKNDGTIWDYG